MRAGWSKTALGTEYRGNDPLVKLDQCDKWETKDLKDCFHSLCPISFSKLQLLYLLLL